jgi:hypothetical protein
LREKYQPVVSDYAKRGGSAAWDLSKRGAKAGWGFAREKGPAAWGFVSREAPEAWRYAKQAGGDVSSAYKAARSFDWQTPFRMQSSAPPATAYRPPAPTVFMEAPARTVIMEGPPPSMTMLGMPAPEPIRPMPVLQIGEYTPNRRGGWGWSRRGRKAWGKGRWSRRSRTRRSWGSGRIKCVVHNCGSTTSMQGALDRGWGRKWGEWFCPSHWPPRRMRQRVQWDPYSGRKALSPVKESRRSASRHWGKEVRQRAYR